MTDHAKRIWLHAIAIVAKARNKCAPGERFEALNLVMGDLEDARRRDQLIAPYFPAACPDCGQHCETHNGESDCAALQPSVSDAQSALETYGREKVREGMRLAAGLIAKRRDDYISEYGIYDPTTGVTEFPGNGDEYVSELDDCEAAILAAMEKLK